MMYSTYLDRKIWQIPLREIVLLLGVYFFFAVTYFITLVLNSRAVYSFYLTVPIDYLLKFIVIIPFWWLYFRRLKDWSIRDKILLHFCTLPMYVFIWINLYYTTCDVLDLGHLTGVASVWDLYIPTLIYFIQFGILHVYDYYKKLQKEKELAASLRQIALQSELSALKAQINPHFLYNVFNTISASVPPAQEKTRIMIATLSDLFRYQLKASKVELVTIAEEVEFIQKYLDLEKERFGDRLDYHLHLSSDIMQEKIPPLLIQPLVENAIKHGISNQVKGGRLDLYIAKKEGELQIEVKDSGPGINTADIASLLQKGVGLSNTHDRLEKMYGQGVQFKKNTPKGLKVYFSIPLQYAESNYSG